MENPATPLRSLAVLRGASLLLLSQSVGGSTFYCGNSWQDAAKSCGVQCPNGNSTACPLDKPRCFRDISCDEHTEPTADSYCGSSWQNAAETCGVKCPNGNSTACPMDQPRCFADVTCTSTTSTTHPPTTDDPIYTSTEIPTTSSTSIGTTVGTTTTSSPSTTVTEAPTTTTTTTTTSTSTTPFPTTSLVTSTTTPSNPGTIQAVEAALYASKHGIDNRIFLYEVSTGSWEPSSVYRYDGFLAGLRVMYQDGVANKLFYMGDDSAEGHKYGLVNIAAFLAQSMKETIKYDACDENSWDRVNSRYPLSNACGQLGQSYQDYHCSPEEAHMECKVDPNMEITAVTNAKWYGAPGPLKCGPKTKYPFTGYWDFSKECDKSWADPPEFCNDYEGQVAGGEVNDAPYENQNGRTDVEGCCWWGRGVIQTTGICNFGKLNYYLGKRAADEGRPSRYPTIDFCVDPEAICASDEFKELKWIAGMFYWVESLQTYNQGGWDYITKLHEFVDGGMTDTKFIDSVSGIVNRGCHNPPCGTGPLDGGAERRSNFEKVLAEFGLQ